ncbi:NAD(P)-dependent oxidoreductase [Eupransor demetentiae]|uniref:NADH-flavin reductase (YwnB) n=1 Tax=Eupransor demetentiae TaxID=3109584 RepID=A0ABM9N572_9LACO|nr:Putative NADH-flavin reductase (YwnB) [Lactobacillaceae bacterium LMG 33000]
MKIGIIGATGKLGSILTKKLAIDGEDVTAIVRHPERLNSRKNIHILNKDLFDLKPEDVQIFDVVISTYGPSVDKPQQLVDAMQHLADIFSEQKIKLVVTGGVGPLYLDNSKNLRVADSTDVPKPFVALAKAEAKSFDILKQAYNVDWLYFAPAFELSTNRASALEYVISGDVLRFADDGTSSLSYELYADAIVNLIQTKPSISHEIISVSEK